jgi:hypothetical protein
MSAQKSTTTLDADEKVTPEHLRAKFNELQGGVDASAEAAKGTAVAIGTVVAVVVVLGVFMLGLRRGKKRTTVVEIRRV